VFSAVKRRDKAAFENFTLLYYVSTQKLLKTINHKKTPKTDKYSLYTKGFKVCHLTGLAANTEVAQ